MHSQGQARCQMKPNSSRKSNFKVSCTVFQTELRNHKKCGNFYTFWAVFWTFLQIFQFYWNTAHKTLKFDFLYQFFLLDTLLVTSSARVVEIEIISKIVLFEMILRSNTPVYIRSIKVETILEKIGHLVATLGIKLNPFFLPPIRSKLISISAQFSKTLSYFSQFDSCPWWNSKTLLIFI